MFLSSHVFSYVVFESGLSMYGSHFNVVASLLFLVECLVLSCLLCELQ